MTQSAVTVMDRILDCSAAETIGGEGCAVESLTGDLIAGGSCVRPFRPLWFALIAVSIAGCGAKPGPADSPSMALGSTASADLPRVAVHDLGVVVREQSIVMRHWVQNASEKALQASEVRTSCECLSVRLAKSEIPSGGRVLGEFTFDSSKDPDFFGSLRIEVEIVDEPGEIAAKLEVPVEVVSDTDDSSP